MLGRLPLLKAGLLAQAFGVASPAVVLQSFWLDTANSGYTTSGNLAVRIGFRQNP